MEEVWKDIKFTDTDGIEYDYTGLYQISNMGRVRSMNYNHTGKEKLLKINKFVDKNYYYVTLRKNKKSKVHRVHRLVAHMFLERKDGQTQVNHKDEDGSNNHVDNLEWCTTEYNLNYGTRSERAVQKKKGERKVCKGFKATNVKTGEIIIYSNITEVEKDGFCDTHVYECCYGKFKTHKGYKWEKIW